MFSLIRSCFRNTCKWLQGQGSVSLLYLMLMNFRPAQPGKTSSSLPGARASPFLPWTFCLFSTWTQSGLTDKNKQERGAFQELWRGRELGKVVVAISALFLMPPVSAGRTHRCGDKVTTAPVPSVLPGALGTPSWTSLGPLEGVYVCVCVCAHSVSRVWLFATPWTVAHHAPLSTGFTGKNIRVGRHFLLQGIFLTQGLNLCLLHLLHWRGILYQWATWEALLEVVGAYNFGFHIIY